MAEVRPYEPRSRVRRRLRALSVGIDATRRAQRCSERMAGSPHLEMLEGVGRQADGALAGSLGPAASTEG